MKIIAGYAKMFTGPARGAGNNCARFLGRYMVRQLQRFMTVDTARERKLPKVVKAMAEAGYVPVYAVAHRLGLAPTTIYRWAHAGVVASQIVSGMRFVLRASLREHVGAETFDRLVG